MGETVVGRQLRTYSSSLHSRQSGEGNRPRSGSMRRLAVAFGVKPSSSSPKKESKDLRKKSLLSLGRSRAASRADPTDTPNPSPASLIKPTPEQAASATKRPVTPTAAASRPVTPAADRSVSPVPESAPLSPSSNFMTPPETPLAREPESYHNIPLDDAPSRRRDSSTPEMRQDSGLPASIPILNQNQHTSS